MSTEHAQRILKRSVADGECLVWTGAKISTGYGCIAVDGKTQLTHRVVWSEAVGPIPDDMTIDHLCRNKLCINVEHLEVVTRAENIRRKHALQTHCKHGHELAGDNLRIHVRPTGTFRRCRTCAADEKSRWKARQAA